MQVDASRRRRRPRRSDSVPGVTRVAESERRDGVVGFEVDSEAGRDVRRDLARAVVSSGLGLLELRPIRMSLEEIFPVADDGRERRRRGRRGDRSAGRRAAHA